LLDYRDKINPIAVELFTLPDRWTPQYDKIKKERENAKHNIPIYVAVITTDENKKFDKFLLSEGIRVYRVPQEELI
jgi:hypothetical protein